MCADTVVHEEEEEDPSDGKLYYDALYERNALLSDLSSTGKSSTSSVSPPTNTTGGAYNQYNQEELSDLFNITYNNKDIHSLSPMNTNTDSVTPSNQFKLITPMQNHTRSKSAAGNSSPLLSLDYTIIDRSKSAAGNSSPLLSLASSSFIAIIDTMEREGEGKDTKMAETKKSEQWEESHENAGGAKPDEDDQDGQDYKKQRSAESYSMSSRTGEKRKSRAVKNQQKSRLFLSERSRLYEFSQSNRILLVIPSSQSVNEESSTVHTLNPSIEAADAEILRVYDDIVKDYPDLIIETGRTETTISYKLHELVPFSIGLCREMVVRDNSNKDSLAIRSAIKRDGSLDKVFANCIRIVTNEYVNNIAQFIIVQSFLF
jgi:hypothetical protein